MTSSNNYRAMNSATRIDGIRFSVILIVSFVCMIGGMKVSPLLGTLSMVLLIYAPFFVGRCVATFRERTLNGSISFGRAYGYSFLTIMYGSLLLALAQWLYFQFLDNGALVNEYVKIFSDPEYKELLNKSGISANDRKLFIESITSLRPIDLALQFLSTNLLIGAFLSIFIALITKRNKK